MKYLVPYRRKRESVVKYVVPYRRRRESVVKYVVPYRGRRGSVVKYVVPDRWKRESVAKYLGLYSLGLSPNSLPDGHSWGAPTMARKWYVLDKIVVLEGSKNAIVSWSWVPLQASPQYL